MDIMNIVRALPGGVAQGLMWAVLALGVYVSYKILDFADLSVDGSLATGGAVAIVSIEAGVPALLAMLLREHSPQRLTRNLKSRRFCRESSRCRLFIRLTCIF